MQLEISEALIARQPSEAQAIIRALLAKIHELEARLNQSPRNSSLPPSTEHPHAKPQRPKARAKRQRGGQPGHRKQVRPLLPTEQCDAMIPLKPSACRRCGNPLGGEDATPLRHQVWELPEIKPQVLEYQRHRLRCACCGATTCADLPAGVPTGQSGPRLVAFAGLLMAFFRQSKRRVALFLETLLNQPCCPALSVKMQTQVTAALRPAYEELTHALPAQPYLNIDESPTKEAQIKSWLWTFVGSLFTVFAWRPTKAATVLSELLTPAFAGVVTCDRAKMY
jgi:transposase